MHFYLVLGCRFLCGAGNRFCTGTCLLHAEKIANLLRGDMFPIAYAYPKAKRAVRDNGIITKKAAYVILGINCEGHKEVLSLAIGENETSKFWLNALNELKNRGLKDIMVICADGLTGIKEAISAAVLIITIP